jgi:hypothetical protein
MLEQMEITTIDEALWKCDRCQAWWGSQADGRGGSRLLLDLPEAFAEVLPWDDYRGWKIAGAEISVCPQCGNTVMHPLFSRH